jgi:L-alanine-DL-glutamate epimerase-like enolase superfamily enzyme
MVRDRIPVAHSIGLMDTSVAISEAKEVVSEGITTLKVKIGVDARRDIDLVHMLRHELGPQIGLRVDANQGYRSWKEALAVIRALEDCNVLLVEQPVEGLENMARIAQATHVPIMADESAWTARDVLRLARLEAAEMISCYYTKPGGLMHAKALLSVAEAAGFSSDINGSAEMGIGNAANLHLAAACAAVDLPGTIPVTSTAEIERTKTAGRLYLDDIITEPFVYEHGHLVVPTRPGLGIEVDESKLKKYRISGPQVAA